MSGFGRRLIAALCIFSLSAPAYATTTYRVDKGIVEEVKLAIQESKKQLERYVINSLDDLETIKSLKDLASDYDDLLSIGDDLCKFLSEANSKEFKDGISPESLLASIAGEVEESEGIESGRIDGGTLSGKSGELSDIAKKEGYATALFTAVSRASEISEMRAEELTGEGTGVSTSSSKGRLADIAGIGGANAEEKALNFIAAIREMNEYMGIPKYIKAKDGSDLIKEEDIPAMVEHALKEANPLYPVPKFMGKEEMTRMYYVIQGK